MSSPELNPWQRAAAAGLLVATLAPNLAYSGDTEPPRQASPTDEILDELTIRRELMVHLDRGEAATAQTIYDQLPQVDQADVQDVVPFLEAFSLGETINRLDGQTDLEYFRSQADTIDKPRLQDILHTVAGHRQAALAFDQAGFLDPYQRSSDDIPQLRAQLADIPDETARTQALQFVDATQAIDILRSRWLPHVTVPDQATVIADPAIQELFRQAQASDSETATTARAELELLASTRTYQDTAWTARTDILDYLDAWKSQTDYDIARWIQGYNDVQPTVVPELLPLSDPDATIDLTDLEAIDTIGDSPVPEPSWTERQRPQFAEVRSGEGELALHITAKNMPAKTKQQLEALMERQRPVWEAGFASGELVTVRFTTLDSTNPQADYYPDTREVIFTLAQHDRLTVETLDALSLHVLTQALTTRQLKELSSYSPALPDDLEHACDTLEEAMAQDLAHAAETHQNTIDQLIEHAKPEHRQVVEQLFEDIRSGQLDTLVTIGMCDGSLYELQQALIGTAEQFAISAEDIAYLEETGGYRQVDAWLQEIQATGTLYQLLNPLSDLPGHPQASPFDSNIQHRVASAGSGALGFNRDYLQAIQLLPPDKKQAAIDMIRASTDFIREQHPSLADALATFEAALMQQIYFPPARLE